jgi:hypothetical protein
MNTAHVNFAALLLWGAAAIHWAGVLVNVTAPHFYQYRKHLPKDETIRQIFIGQAVWVTIMLAALGTACIWYAPLLAGSSPLAIFLLILWSARLFMQILFYRSEPRRQHPVRYWIFFAAFTYQVLLFSLICSGGLNQ